MKPFTNSARLNTIIEAMEAETISKNAASPKSLMSRGNILIVE